MKRDSCTSARTAPGSDHPSARQKQLCEFCVALKFYCLLQSLALVVTPEDPAAGYAARYVSLVVTPLTHTQSLLPQIGRQLHQEERASTPLRTDNAVSTCTPPLDALTTT